MSIEIDTSEYVRSHFRQPRGEGSWAFRVTVINPASGSFSTDREPTFTPSMRYTDAKVWIKARARAENPSYKDFLIEVLP
jgi:hypothetical protein